MRNGIPLVAMVLCLSTPGTGQQLDETWTLTVGGKTVRAEPDGGFLIQNISAADSLPQALPGGAPCCDFLSDEYLRLIGRSEVHNLYAYSDPFRLRNNETFTVPLLHYSTEPPPFPQQIRVSVSPTTITTELGTSQANALGILLDGSTIDVTSQNSIYTSSNPSIASVNALGQIVGRQSGTTVITATHEGATATARLIVSLGDPLTTVVGRVQFESGQPAPGAAVSITGLAGPVLTDGDGAFLFQGVPTQDATAGPLQYRVVATLVQGADNYASAVDSVLPLPGRITDAGIMTLSPISCSFDPDIGQSLNLSDDSFAFVPFDPSFSFPYFGLTFSGVFVSSNGYVTFNQGDGTYCPSIPQGVIQGLPRIAPAFVDFLPSGSNNVYVASLPDRFTVTWYHLPLYDAGGDNTFQLALFSNGVIHFVYNGMTATGSEPGACPIELIRTAVSPGGNPPLMQVSYLNDAPFASGPGAAVMQVFNPTTPFDLDFTCVLWTPTTGNGFDVGLAAAPAAPQLGQIIARLDDAVPNDAGVAVTVRTSNDLRSEKTLARRIDGSYFLGDLPVPCTARLVAYNGASVVGTKSLVLTKRRTQVTLEATRAAHHTLRPK